MKIKELLKYLKENKVEHLIVKEEVEPLIFRIDFPLGVDSEGRERVVQLLIQEQILLEEEHYSYQFLYSFPFKTSFIATADIARYIAFLNTNQDFPGFTFNEIEESVALRILQFNLSSPQTIVAILGMITITLSLFSSHLEKVAKGMITMNETLEEMVNLDE